MTALITSTAPLPEPALETDHIPPPPQSRARLVSLDALRGLNMFWIIGIDELIPRLSQYSFGQSDTAIGRTLRFLSTQLNHADWEGMHFEDLIFPLFVFIVGISLVFSLTKTIALHGQRGALIRILYRSAILYLLGILLYHGFDQPIHAFPGMTHEHHAIRWFGVLQRIALCYAAAGLLFVTLRPRWLVLITVLILLGYWLALTFIPVPGVGTHSYAEGRNLTNYLDQHYLGGWKWDGDHDPEGYLSTLPAIATCLLGVFAGMLLRRDTIRPSHQVLILIVGGCALAALGYAWGFCPSPVQFPVIKKIWTSSYVLLAGGYSAMLMGAFYFVIDLWRLRAWSAPFVWIGTNAITIYMLAELGYIENFATRLVGGGNHTIPIFGSAQDAITLSVSLLLTFLIARFLYVRKIFIRV